MSWRIAESVVRGEIDKRLPGIIKGTLYLDGLKEPVALELEGNCDPDLAGRCLVFRNLMPPSSKSLEGFGRIQCGEAGTMTANRMFTSRITAMDGCKTHPMVKRVSEFLLQVICESKSRKFCGDEAIENQPLEGMIEATTRATIRLAHALARVTGPVARFESPEIVHGLNRARWSLAEASEHAGLGRHMCTADSDWLQELRCEFGALRKEIRGLIHEFQDAFQESTPATTDSPTDLTQGE